MGGGHILSKCPINNSTALAQLFLIGLLTNDHYIIRADAAFGIIFHF